MNMQISERSIAAAVLILCSIAAVSCGSGDPIIALETDHLDMGMIPSYEDTTKRVKVYNRGDGPLSILQIQSGCGCTSGRMLNPFIPAGSEGILEITIDPAKVTSMTSTQTVTLRSNDPENPAVPLLVSSQVQREILALPAAMMGGTAVQGQGATAEVRLVQNADIPFVITDLQMAGPDAGYFEGSYEEIPESDRATEGRREYVVRSRMAPSAPTGKLKATLEVKTEDPRLSRLSIPIRVTVEPLYAIHPRNFVLGPLEPGTTVADAFTLVMRAPVEVTNVRGQNEHLNVTWREGDNPATITFDVTVGEDAPPPSLRDALTVSVRSGEEEFREEVALTVRIDSDAVN